MKRLKNIYFPVQKLENVLDDSFLKSECGESNFIFGTSLCVGACSRKQGRIMVLAWLPPLSQAAGSYWKLFISKAHIDRGKTLPNPNPGPNPNPSPSRSPQPQLNLT